MKAYRLFLLALVASPLFVQAQTVTGPFVTMPLWPKGVPETVPMPGPETDITKPTDRLVNGKPLMHLTNVSVPTLAVYKPAAAQDSGAAVVVFPGGSYKILAYDLEGTEVCTWLNSIGVTCVLVKYRVPIPGPSEKVFGHFPEHVEDLEDAQQAMRITRAHAAEWKIDPKRVGVLGFSAGGHLVAVLSNHYLWEPPAVADAGVVTTTKSDARPDFVIMIYPAYLTNDALTKLSPEVVPSELAPPTFIVQAEDDPVHEECALLYYQGLKAAKVKAELHLFAEGGHGYGLRPGPLPVTHWPEFAGAWLKTIGVLAASK